MIQSSPDKNKSSCKIIDDDFLFSFEKHYEFTK